MAVSYSDIVSGLTSVVKKLPDFSGGNVTNADYRVLSTGVGQAIIIFPGAFTQEQETPGMHPTFFVNWDLRIELYVRYSTDQEVAAKIAQFRSDVVNKVNQYPFLNGTTGVLNALIRRGDAPIPVFRPDGTGPYFWLQTMICSVQEDSGVDQLED